MKEQKRRRSQPSNEPQTAETGVVYSLPVFERLRPTAPFTGGRIAETDLLTLQQAADMAALHCGKVVVVEDFIRAAGRGEIRLHALCPRDVVLQPTLETDEKAKAVNAPQGSYLPLPANACKALALSSATHWRGEIEAFQQTAHGPASWIRWKLAEDEPDLTATTAECVVKGYDVMALADAFKEVVKSEDDATSAESVVPRPPGHFLWPAGTDYLQFDQLPRLVADAIWPDRGPDDERSHYAGARVNLEDELNRAVDAGRLRVLDSLTFGPHTLPYGDARKQAMVSFDGLADWWRESGRGVLETRPSPEIADLQLPVRRHRVGRDLLAPVIDKACVAVGDSRNVCVTPC